MGHTPHLDFYLPQDIARGEYVHVSGVIFAMNYFSKYTRCSILSCIELL